MKKAIVFLGKSNSPFGVIDWPNKPDTDADGSLWAKADLIGYLQDKEKALASAAPFDLEQDRAKVLAAFHLAYRSIVPTKGTPYFIDLEWRVEEVKCKPCRGTGKIWPGPGITEGVEDCQDCQGTGERKVARLRKRIEEEVKGALCVNCDKQFPITSMCVDDDGEYFCEKCYMAFYGGGIIPTDQDSLPRINNLSPIETRALQFIMNATNASEYCTENDFVEECYAFFAKQLVLFCKSELQKMIKQSGLS